MSGRRFGEGFARLPNREPVSVELPELVEWDPFFGPPVRVGEGGKAWKRDDVYETRTAVGSDDSDKSAVDKFYTPVANSQRTEEDHAPLLAVANREK